MNFRDIALNYAKVIVWYWIILFIGVLVVLVAAEAIGYLPYSDRPGPSWQGPSFSFREVAFFASWGTLLLLPALIYGTTIYAMGCAIRALRSPMIVIRLVCGLCAAFNSILLVAGIGWYIALAPFVSWIAGALGFVWGATLLPKYLGAISPEKPTVPRWTLICLIILAVPVLTHWRILFPAYSQCTEAFIMRITQGDKELALTDAWKKSLTPDEQTLLLSLYPRGELHSGVAGSWCSETNLVTARMLVVVTTGIKNEVKLRIPKGASAVYVQQGNDWKMYPPSAPTLREFITIDSAKGGGSFEWPTGNALTFTWQPAIF